jgi:hypothetical protein
MRIFQYPRSSNLRKTLIGLLIAIMVLSLYRMVYSPFSMSSEEEAKASMLVSRLSSESIGGRCAGAALFYFPDGKEAEELLKMGRKTSLVILPALKDPNKSVAAHLLLCKMWSYKESYSTEVKYIYDDSSTNVTDHHPLLGWTTTIDGVSWSWREETGNRIGNKELLKAYKQWKYRMLIRRILGTWLPTMPMS